MKKIILCIMICILFLTGCQAQSLIENDKQAEPEEIILKWMVYGERYKASDEVFQLFNEELQEYFPNTSIEFEIVEKENYKEAWDMKMATNETFDLAWMGNDLFSYSEEVKKGSMMALDYLISTSGQDLLKDIPETLWEMEFRDGNTFAIPVDGIMYRKDLYLVTKKQTSEQYGDMSEIEDAFHASKHTTAKCYNLLEDYLSYVQSVDGLGTGVSYESICYLPDKGYEGIYRGDSPFVIDIFDNDLQVYNKYMLSSYKIFFETMASWYQQGYIRGDIDDVIDPSSEDGKQEGSILFLDEYSEAGVVGDMIQLDYEGVYIPINDYRYRSYDSIRNSIVIPKSSENPQRAMEVINLLFSEEGVALYRLLVNGFEDEHYIVLEDESIARRRNNDDELLYGLSQYTIGNTYSNYELSQGQFDRVKIANENAMTSPLTGFSLDTRLIVLDLTKIDLIVEEYFDALCRGSSEDYEELYNKFILKMEEAGSTRIIDEMQRQIDEFEQTIKP